MASVTAYTASSAKEGTLRIIPVISFIAVLCVGIVGCGKKDDGSKDKKIGQLETKLQQAQEQETTLKGELAQLNQRVTRLQNDFKIYSQKPCEFELDPIEYTINKKPDAAMYVPQPMGMSGMARPEPSGTPEALRNWKVKAAQTRYGIKRCYVNAAKKSAALQVGSRRVKLKFTINPSGRMGRIMVIPPIGAGFEGCIRSLLRQWRFNSFGGGAKTFELRLNLRPQ
jgi:hypothetical protein